MRGTLGKITEAVDFIPIHVYRAMLVVESFVKIAGGADLFKRLGITH
jgi:hypothetical protein